MKSIQYSKPTNLVTFHTTNSNSNEQTVSKPANIEPSKEVQAIAQSKNQTNETVSQKQPPQQQGTSLKEAGQNKSQSISSMQQKATKPVVVNNKANLPDVSKTPTMQSNKPKPSVASRINPGPTVPNTINVNQIAQVQTTNPELVSRTAHRNEPSNKTNQPQEGSIAFLAPLKIDKNFISRTVNFNCFKRIKN